MKLSNYMIILNIFWSIIVINHYVRDLIWLPLAIVLVAQIIATIAIIKCERSKF